MSVALEDFDRDRDRPDPQRAARLFELLWPDPAVRAACADRLAKSIRHAHRQADASWEVTMFVDRIRFNVGQVEVLTLSSDEIVCCFVARSRQGLMRDSLSPSVRLVRSIRLSRSLLASVDLNRPISVQSPVHFGPHTIRLLT